MKKTDYQLVQGLTTLLGLVADVMQELKDRGVTVNFSINPTTDPVSVVGPTATKEVKEEINHDETK